MTSGLARLGRKMLAGTAVLACLVLLLPSVSALVIVGVGFVLTAQAIPQV